jgi:hypothetical protein
MNFLLNIVKFKYTISETNEMELPLLSDKDQYPAEEVISSNIGKTWTIWQSLFQYLHADHPDISEEWRYYNDGKSWLMKVTRKGKTIFWLSVIKGSFLITFYFTDRAEEAINKSSISDELKEQFSNGKKYSKIRGLTIKFKNKKDIEYFKAMLVLKLSIK